MAEVEELFVVPRTNFIRKYSGDKEFEVSRYRKFAAAHSLRW